MSFSLASLFLTSISENLKSTSLKYANYFESKFYDYRSFNHQKEGTSKDIVLIKIDDESLQKIGMWPIPRINWVTLLEHLKELDVKVVSFDVMFPEKSGQYINKKSVDELLEASIASFQKGGENFIILPYTVQNLKDNNSYEEVPEDLFNMILDSKVQDGFSLNENFVEKYTYPLKTLLTSSSDLAYISMDEDGDGVFRGYKFVSNIDSLYLPSLALRSLERYLSKTAEVRLNSAESSLLIDNKTLELNKNGESKIRWLGSKNYYSEISLYDILDKEKYLLYKNLLQGKIAFIASTAKGAHDLRNSPIDSKLPGVYAHMNAVSMFLDSYFYKSQNESFIASVLLLFGSLILLFIFMSFKRATFDLLSVTGIISALYFIDSSYFIKNGYELGLFFIFFALITSYSWITFLNFREVSREKKVIKGAFSRYVAKSVMDEMLDHPEKLKIGGERKIITCLFSDVRNFTSISEGLSATELAKILNIYMGKMTDIVFDTKGTLDKYIGDAIVAFWGAPIEDKNHAQNALDAAVLMLEEIPSINSLFKENNYPEFHIGIGLNSGECNVGNMGSDHIFSYTALGDNMNLGARLESLCKHYGAQILISEYTYNEIDKNKYKIRLIDNVVVKGKEQPVRVYEVLHSYHPMNDEEKLLTFKEAYNHFINKNFIEAKEKFIGILKSNDDIPSKHLLKKCEEFIKTPPDDNIDHTITVMTEK